MWFDSLSRPARTLSAGLVAVAGLSGCADFSGIASVAKMLDAPALGLRAEPSQAAAPQLSPMDIPAQWWLAYQDAQLNHLIELAIKDSPSLRVAQARQARAAAGSELVASIDAPQTGVGMDASHQKFTAKGMYPPPLAGAVLDSGTLQAAASWEWDLFGKNRAALDAALGQVNAAQADAQAARMLLTTQVVRSYIRLSQLHAQLTLAQNTLQQRQDMLQLVQQRLQAGLDTQLELQQSQSLIPDARLQIEALKEQSTLALNALTALCGQPQGSLHLNVAALSAFHSMAVPQALPLDLLGRRADVVAARWRVEAATQDVQQSRAQFYPNINLTAYAGYSSIGLDKLLQSGSEQWGIGPAIRLPLFDGGRLRANLRGKSADLDAAVETYNALVLDAVRDAADQLASVQAIARQQSEQATARAAAQATLDVARQRHREGISNYLQVLSAQTAVLAQDRQATDLQARALDAQVQLIRALGGGYTADATLPTVNRTTQP